MKFYLINEGYLNFLRSAESKIMYGSSSYNHSLKFTVGIIIEINNAKYYAPVSSVKPNQLESPTSLNKRARKTSIPIFVNDHGSLNIASVIRLDFMFPVPDSEIHELIFNNISDQRYKYFIQQEYQYVLSIRNDIISKAQYVYSSAIDPTHFFNKLCCNFKLLEVKHQEWIKNNNK